MRLLQPGLLFPERQAPEEFSTLLEIQPADKPMQGLHIVRWPIADQPESPNPSLPPNASECVDDIRDPLGRRQAPNVNKCGDRSLVLIPTIDRFDSDGHYRNWAAKAEA